MVAVPERDGFCSTEPDGTRRILIIQRSRERDDADSSSHYCASFACATASSLHQPRFLCARHPRLRRR